MRHCAKVSAISNVLYEVAQLPFYTKEIAWLQPFLPITVDHLSYLSQPIEIWILKYPLQAVSDISLNNLWSCKGQISPQGRSKELGGSVIWTNRGETFYPSKGQISPQELRYITQERPQMIWKRCSYLTVLIISETCERIIISSFNVAVANEA